MELTHQLTPYLTKLRLSGILQTLEARNRQAVDGHWSYVEFLSRLLEDEVERRAQKQLTLRLRRAAVNSTKTLGRVSRWGQVLGCLPAFGKAVAQNGRAHGRQVFDSFAAPAHAGAA